MATFKGRKLRQCIMKCKEYKHTYSFPQDEVGRSVWLKQLGLQYASKRSSVCDRHFSARMKCDIGAKLQSWAIPDLNLPEPPSDEDDYSEEFYLEEADDDNDEDYHEETKTPATLNGYSKNKIGDVEESKVEFSANKHSNHSMMVDDPLEFDGKMKKKKVSGSKNNNNNEKATSNQDGECEEYNFEAEYVDEGEVEFDDLQISTTPSPTVTNAQNQTEETTIKEPLEVNSTFKRKLIASVRRRRILYDPAHPCFGNIEKKMRAWKRIGKILKLDGTLCRELWLNMRYAYQNHVRNLRRWLAGEYGQRERPKIQFENDLLFLWRFIEDKSAGDDIDDSLNQPRSIMTENITIAPEPKISDVPKYVEEKPKDKSVTFVGHLIEAVEPYSELYDTMNPNYGNAKRRSLIWEAISSELREKATKCLFSWIQLTFRYEFELTFDRTSYLVIKMNFLKKHILLNAKSPFKRTVLLKNQWVDPIYSAAEQHMFLSAMISNKRTRPYFANIDCPFATIDLLKVPCWLAVARARKYKPVKCEITWIIMQMLYCELADYRRNDCRLHDEWEFESIITNLRDTIVNSKIKKPAAREEAIPMSNHPVSIIKNSVVNSSTPMETNDIDHDDMMSITINDSPPSPLPLPEEREPTPPPPSPSPPAVPKTPPPPPSPKNEITFKIPGKSPGDVGKLVKYKLDTTLAELPEIKVVDVGSVVEDAHVVIFTRNKTEPKIFLFSSEKRKELIGEIMARPIIFNEPCQKSRITRLFMGEIATDMGIPAEVCSGFWAFILENSLFVDFDYTWKKSKQSKWIPAPYPIFEKFQKHAEVKNWNESIAALTDFIQEIGNFPLIYSDLKINSSWNRRQCHARDISEAWTILARKFGVLENHKLIWDKFKQIFLLYMSEMELSMYNPWPAFWAPVFEKMKFLFEFKYNPKDPIYYVIRAKINEEIALSKQNTNAPVDKFDAVTNAKMIFRLLKENEYLEDFTWVNRARFISKMKSFPMLYDVSHPLFGDREAKLDAWQEIALLFHCTVGECHLIFQNLMKSFLIFRARDPNQLCRVNAKYWENMAYIYSCAVPNAIDAKSMEGRSFRSSSNGSTIKLAEEYQAEISLVDAKPKLILKNIAAAVNSLPEQIQKSVTQTIGYICSEYTRTQADDIVVDV